ncbi:hypothetical protein EDB87DRAFT_1580836 [Lactarius vividus]|nr:hypothetical protein EDB87DRAFT_1580836 [Lactarius vividus]
MPARTDAGVPVGHSLALFTTDHTARNEVDRALALVADPGAAADVHRFRLSMKRKQDLFAHMRDLDIAWNDWLAGAEDIDQRLRASNISSRIFPFLPQPLPCGLDIYHINEADSNNCRFRAHLDHLDGLDPIPIPPRPCNLTTAPLHRTPLLRPDLHGEEQHSGICLYCDQNHTARLCPRPHVLCEHATRCNVLVHHPGFGAPCPRRVIHSPRPEPYNQINPDRVRCIEESLEGKARGSKEGVVSRSRDT